MNEELLRRFEAIVLQLENLVKRIDVMAFGEAKAEYVCKYDSPKIQEIKDLCDKIKAKTDRIP